MKPFPFHLTDRIEVHTLSYKHLSTQMHNNSLAFTRKTNKLT